MAEELQQPGADSPGWRAGLPSDLRENEAFTSYKTVGDFAKAHLETSKKLKDAEGKLGNTISKLGENATPEERNQFFNSLGRPEKAEGYELEGGDKDKEDHLLPWKQDFHNLGLTAAQAKGIKAAFDGRLIKMVDDHNAKTQAEIAEASTKLKTELRDKYDASIELAQRLWKKETDTDFDKAFAGETSANRFTMVRFLLKMAAKTGEDSSLRGNGQRSTGVPPPFINYDKSPTPPSRRM